MQVAPEFLLELRKIQGQLLLEGKQLSLRDITLNIAKSGQLNLNEFKKEIRIKMDRRGNYV